MAYPSKANVVAAALNKLSMCSVAHIEEERIEQANVLHKLARLGIRVILWEYQMVV